MPPASKSQPSGTRLKRIIGAGARLALRWSLLLLLFVPGEVRADDLLERGRALAERLCARCHMAPGQGEKRADNEIPGFAAVAARPGQTFEGLVAWLRSVPPVMPDHHLTQDEMAALAEFILSLRPQ